MSAQSFVSASFHIAPTLRAKVGHDPVSYFLAFARLAAAQVAWWGHADTTGISSIDYFVSSDVEVPAADAHYSERLVRLKGLGAFFLKPAFALGPVAASTPPRLNHTAHGTAAPSNQSAAQHGGDEGSEEVDPSSAEAFQGRRSRVRQEVAAMLSLPKQFHFYLCPQALVKFHPTFDEVLLSLLEKDKLAYVLLLDGADRRAWTEALMDRLAGRMLLDRAGAGSHAIPVSSSSSSGGGRGVHADTKFAQEVSAARASVERRLLFVGGDNERGVTMAALYESADVVLDLFPTSGYVTSLQALCVGAPVVTLPSTLLGGRLTLALYQQMGFKQRVAAPHRGFAAAAGRESEALDVMGLLVAESPADFVTKALSVAFSPLVRREALRVAILGALPHLWEDRRAVEQWDVLLSRLADEHYAPRSPT